jgi:hypothetical protein
VRFLRVTPCEATRKFHANENRRIYRWCSSHPRTGIKLNRHRTCWINQTCAASGQQSVKPTPPQTKQQHSQSAVTLQRVGAVCFALNGYFTGAPKTPKHASPTTDCLRDDWNPVAGVAREQGFKASRHSTSPNALNHGLQSYTTAGLRY